MKFRRIYRNRFLIHHNASFEPKCFGCNSTSRCCKNRNCRPFCIIILRYRTPDHYPLRRYCQAMFQFRLLERNFPTADCSGNSDPLNRNRPNFNFNRLRQELPFRRIIRRNFRQSSRDLRLRQIRTGRIVSLHFMCVTSASILLQQNKLTPQINPIGNPVCSRLTVTPTMSRIT